MPMLNAYSGGSIAMSKTGQSPLYLLSSQALEASLYKYRPTNKPPVRAHIGTFGEFAVNSFRIKPKTRLHMPILKLPGKSQVTCP
jgi:hypothetical protein